MEDQYYDVQRCVIYRFMRSVESAGMTAGLCGGIGTDFKHNNVISSKKPK